MTKQKKRRVQGSKIESYDTQKGTRYRFWIDGPKNADGSRNQQKHSGFKSLNEAIAKRAELVVEVHGKVMVNPNEVTFGEYFDQWRQDHGALRWANSTKDTAQRRAAYALKKFGTIPLQELDRMTLKRELLNLLDSGGKNEKALTKKTVRAVAALIKQCLKHAYMNKMVMGNEMDFVELPRMPKRPEVKRPTVSQYDRILERVSNTRYFMLVVFAADAGCRRGELLALQWADVDLETREVTISKSLSVTSKGMEIKCTKGEEEHKLKLSETTIELLKEWRVMIEEEKRKMGDGYEDNDLIFCTETGAYYKPDRITNRISEFMRQAGCKGISTHKLRHYSASFLLGEGVPITDVSARLGHANPEITLKYYGRFMPSNDERAPAAFDQGMGAMVRARAQAAGGQEPRPPAKIALVFPTPPAVSPDSVTFGYPESLTAKPKLYKVKG